MGLGLCEVCKKGLKCVSRTLFEVVVMQFRYADKCLHASKFASVLVRHTTLGMRSPTLALLLPNIFVSEKPGATFVVVAESFLFFEHRTCKLCRHVGARKACCLKTPGACGRRRLGLVFHALLREDLYRQIFLSNLPSVHSSALKSIPHSAAQSAAYFRSFDSFEHIEGGLLPVLYTEVSSANMEKIARDREGRTLPPGGCFSHLCRRALIFFCLKALGKKLHHFCAHAQWWSPWRRRNVEKRHLSPSNLTFY